MKEFEFLCEQEILARNEIPDLFADGKLLTKTWSGVAKFPFDTFCAELEPLERISQGIWVVLLEQTWSAGQANH